MIREVVDYKKVGNGDIVRISTTYITTESVEEKLMNIKDMIYHEDRTKKKVTFTHYCHKELWYTTECGFEFPVPVEDCGDATFLPEDNAPMFMRYIRKHMDSISK